MKGKAVVEVVIKYDVDDERAFKRMAERIKKDKFYADIGSSDGFRYDRVRVRKVEAIPKKKRSRD